LSDLSDQPDNSAGEPSIASDEPLGFTLADIPADTQRSVKSVAAATVDTAADCRGYLLGALARAQSSGASLTYGEARDYVLARFSDEFRAEAERALEAAVIEWREQFAS
jgi:hypothetical protein